MADAVARLGLRHVVITSVTRDDLPDGGAGHYVATIRAIRAAVAGGDHRGAGARFRRGARRMSDAVLAESARRLQPQPGDGARGSIRTVRPQAIYERSLAVLRQAAEEGAQSWSRRA